MSDCRTIILKEYETTELSKDELLEPVGEHLWREYEDKVSVEFPSIKTGNRWRLTAQGWVGQIPVTPEFAISILPKTPVENVFRMLEYAYGLKGFRFLEGETSLHTLDEVYERLAHVLSRRVLDRARKGLYRTYDPRSETLPFVRERMDIGYAIRRPWQVRPLCHYHIHTPDVEDNRLLAWTLYVLRRSGIKREEVRRAVASAHRVLDNAAAPQRFRASDCVDRSYTRLNDDYRVLHALCRFFLEHTGPDLDVGDRTMLPFLIPMHSLFESFVASWMQGHLPARLSLRAQDQVSLGNETYFRIDLVLYRADNPGTAWAVLDTKYKAPEKPAEQDIHQVVSYAVSKGCTEAILVYPIKLTKPLDMHVGGVHVRTVCFALDGDLEAAGQVFLAQLEL